MIMSSTSSDLMVVSLLLWVIFMSIIGSSFATEKKKVLIIGEMSDVDSKDSTAFEGRKKHSSSSSSSTYHPIRSSTSSGSPGGSVFVPVAAYSVTHSRVKGANGLSQRRRHHYHHPSRKHYQIIPAGSSPPRKTTESGVYGYVQKPEIVEFRGQYFYGPNPVSSASSPYTTSRLPTEPSTGWIPGSLSRISNKSGGLGPGGLLLATLPLILAPMLSYLFTPMIIPVTATIAAGKRKKRRRRRQASFPSSSNSSEFFYHELLNHLYDRYEDDV